MAEKSRIRFNPSTNEIEIEGTEKFVKKYFDVIHRMIRAPHASEPIEDKLKPGRAGKRAGRAGKRGSKTSAVLNSIRESKKGMTTAELKEKTGLSDRQIWAIIYKAEKDKNIKRAGRGVYVSC